MMQRNRCSKNHLGLTPVGLRLTIFSGYGWALVTDGG